MVFDRFLTAQLWSSLMNLGVVAPYRPLSIRKPEGRRKEKQMIGQVSKLRLLEVYLSLYASLN